MFFASCLILRKVFSRWLIRLIILKSEIKVELSHWLEISSFLFIEMLYFVINVLTLWPNNFKSSARTPSGTDIYYSEFFTLIHCFYFFFPYVPLSACFVLKILAASFTYLCKLVVTCSNKHISNISI